jgi:hypothetical protein
MYDVTSRPNNLRRYLVTYRGLAHARIYGNHLSKYLNTTLDQHIADLSNPQTLVNCEIDPSLGEQVSPGIVVLEHANLFQFLASPRLQIYLGTGRIVIIGTPISSRQSSMQLQTPLPFR